MSSRIRILRIGQPFSDPQMVQGKCLDWDRFYILPQVRGRNLHTPTLPLGCWASTAAALLDCLFITLLYNSSFNLTVNPTHAQDYFQKGGGGGGALALIAPAASRGTLLHSGERVFGYQVGCWSVQSVSTRKKIRYPDRPQVSHMAWQVEGEECPVDTLELVSSTLHVYCNTQSRCSKRKCWCFVPCCNRLSNWHICCGRRGKECGGLTKIYWLRYALYYLHHGQAILLYHHYYHWACAPYGHSYSVYFWEWFSLKNCWQLVLVCVVQATVIPELRYQIE